MFHTSVRPALSKASRSLPGGRNVRGANPAGYPGGMNDPAYGAPISAGWVGSVMSHTLTTPEVNVAVTTRLFPPNTVRVNADVVWPGGAVWIGGPSRRPLATPQTKTSPLRSLPVSL